MTRDPRENRGLSVHVGVLVDRHDPARGGMERAVSRLVTHLLDSGHAVDVYGLSAAPGAPGTFHVIDVPALPRGALERELAARSTAAARRDGCDVTVATRHAPDVDVYWPHGGAHGATLAAGESARGAMGGSVSRLLHRISPRHRAFLDLEREALTGGARRIWCVSEMVRRELLHAYPGSEQALELQSNGVDRDRYHPRLRAAHRDAARRAWGVDGDAPLLVFPGGNLRLKGWGVLLAALDAVRHERWTCAAVAADAATATRDVGAAGLGGRVLCLPRQEMSVVLGACDLLVQPTYRDPCSLATLEALAAGVPVVTTIANGAADALRDSAAGSVMRPGDIAGLADAIQSWLPRLSSSEDRAAASDAARAATRGRDAASWLDGLTASLARCATAS